MVLKILLLIVLVKIMIYRKYVYKPMQFWEYLFILLICIYPGLFATSIFLHGASK
jgi:hypothetical protein